MRGSDTYCAPRHMMSYDAIQFKNRSSKPHVDEVAGSMYDKVSETTETLSET